MMEPDRWEQIERLYHAALEREPGAREAFLDEACAGDEELRREVAGLLACDVQSDSFIQSPAIEIAARAMAAEPLIEASNKPMGSLIAASRIGAYQLLSPLGRGGMGEVHLALDTRLGRKVAIKLLPAAFTTDAGRVRRFAQEARAASALNHPNIITIHEIGEAATENGSLRYIVTEYVEGETLGQRLRDAPQQRIEPSKAIDIALQIAAALSAAHEAGITHRDIKPENVMVRRDGIVKVLDFGLAKLTESAPHVIDSQAPTLARNKTEDGVVMGTPRYMSPEQARGEKVDARSDIFSLGVMLYEMVTGRKPFEGETVSDVIAAILRDEPPPLAECAPDAPPEMEEILSKTLRKNREERYQAVSELLADLQRLKSRLEQDELIHTTLKSIAKRPYARFQSAEELIADLRAAYVALSGWLSARSEQPAPSGAQTSAQPGLPPALPAIASFSSKILSTLWHSRRARASIGILFAGLLLGILWIRPWPTAEPYMPSPQAKRFYLEGVNSFRDGSYYKARIAFAQVVDIDGGYAIPHARLAEAWMEMDYTGKANAELIQAYTLMPLRMTDVDKLYLDALNLTASHNFAGAIEKYRKLLSTAPDDDKPYIYVGVGRAYERNEDLENASQSYLEAIRLEPQNATAFLRLGMLHIRQLQVPQARAAFDKAETIYRALGNHEGVTEVYFQRGSLSNQLGAGAEAQNLLMKALGDSKSADNKYQQIKCLLELSKVEHTGGRTEEAKKLATEAIKLAEADGIENLATAGLIDLGHAFFKESAYEKAEQYFQKALNDARQVKIRRNEAKATCSLGSLYVQMGKVDEGLPLIEDALRIYQNGGYRSDYSQCILYQGRAKLLKGDYDTAVKILDQQLVIAKQIENPAQIARAQNEFALALGRYSFLPQALQLYEESHTIFKQLGNAFYQSFCLLNRADLLFRLGRYRESRDDLSQLSVLLTGLENKHYKQLWLIWARILNARLALAEGNYNSAISEGEAAFRLANNPSYQSDAAAALSIIGLAQTRSGNFRAGLKTCERAVSLARPTNDQRLISEVTLALARAEFEGGVLSDALANALIAQELFSRNRQPELEWQALCIAGQAYKHVGNSNASGGQFVRASQLLSTLRQNWGEEAFNTYVSRSDLKPLHNSIKEASLNSTKL